MSVGGNLRCRMRAVAPPPGTLVNLLGLHGDAASRIRKKSKGFFADEDVYVALVMNGLSLIGKMTIFGYLQFKLSFIKM